MKLLANESSYPVLQNQRQLLSLRVTVTFSKEAHIIIVQ